MTTPNSNPPAGFYDHEGKQRWWDGTQWTDHYQTAAQPVPVAVAPPVRQAADKAQYVRQQKGHSLILHLTLGAFLLWIPAIYYSVSPNHYWHA